MLLDVLIDREGRPEQVEVFRGDPPFVESAVDAAYSYRFYPAVRRNGEEIKSWVELAVPFGLPQGEVAVGDTPVEVDRLAPVDSLEVGANVLAPDVAEEKSEP